MDRVYKSRNLRYRKAALALIQHDRIDDVLNDMMNDCGELELAVEDDETLIDVFDGDTDEIHEFRLAFTDLAIKCEQLMYALQTNSVPKHFDDFFVGALGDAYRMVGYDSVEEDYYRLTSFEAELAQKVSGKRLMSLTKERLVSVAGQCIGVMMCFLDIRHSYDCLKATLDLLRDNRAELLKNVRTVEDAYQKAQIDPYDRKARDEYDTLVSRLPDRAWVE